MKLWRRKEFVRDQKRRDGETRRKGASDDVPKVR